MGMQIDERTIGAGVVRGAHGATAGHDPRTTRAYRRAAVRRWASTRGTARAHRQALRIPPRMLGEAERRHLIRRAEKHLVSTMRACPAPGISPFTWQEKLTIGAAVFGGALIVALLAATSGAR